MLGKLHPQLSQIFKVLLHLSLTLQLESFPLRSFSDIPINTWKRKDWGGFPWGKAACLQEAQRHRTEGQQSKTSQAQSSTLG